MPCNAKAKIATHGQFSVNRDQLPAHPTYKDPNMTGSYSPLYHTVQYSAPSSRTTPTGGPGLPGPLGPVAAAEGRSGGHLPDSRPPGQPAGNVGSSSDSHSSKGSAAVPMPPASARPAAQPAQQQQQQQQQQHGVPGHTTVFSHNTAGDGSVHQITPQKPQQRPFPQQPQPQLQQPQQQVQAVQPIHLRQPTPHQHGHQPLGHYPGHPPNGGGAVGGGGGLAQYVAGPYSGLSLGLWQPSPGLHPHAQPVSSLRASAPEIEVGRGAIAVGAGGGPVMRSGGPGPQELNTTAAVERRGRASFSGQAATVCISGSGGASQGMAQASREPERRSMDRNPRRVQPVAPALDTSRQLLRAQAPAVENGHLRAAAAAVGAGQAWGAPVDASASAHPGYLMPQTGSRAALPDGRRSFSDGASSSARSLTAAEETSVQQWPRQPELPQRSSEIIDPLSDSASARRVSTQLAGPPASTSEIVNVPRPAAPGGSFSDLSETEELRREVERLRTQATELRENLEARDLEVVRLSRRLRETQAEVAEGGSNHIRGGNGGGVATDTLTLDGGEWDRIGRASLDSHDSGLFSSLRHAEHSSSDTPLTPSSSIHHPRPPPVLLDSVPAPGPPLDSQTINGRNSRASIAGLTSSAVGESSSSGGRDEDRREILRLRERVRLVEEALQLMRDEARARVPSVEAADISYVRLLGRGSFAEVHRATWRLPCAVKRLRDGVRANRYEARKFHREASLLRSLMHPGVLRVFGFCKADFLLITEVVEGGSLHNLIHATQTRLPHTTVLQFTAQVADILRYLHMCRVVHRDLKPENLLVDSAAGGILKLADFGLACEKQGEFIKLPWEGSNFQDVRHAVASAGERPLIPANTPQQLAQLLRDCWHADPEERSKFQENRDNRLRMERGLNSQGELTSSRGHPGNESLVTDSQAISRDRISAASSVEGLFVDFLIRIIS